MERRKIKFPSQRNQKIRAFVFRFCAILYNTNKEKDPKSEDLQILENIFTNL